MLLGEYNYNLDAKGRVFVPAKLRDELGEVFVIAKSIVKRRNVVYISREELELREQEEKHPQDHGNARHNPAPHGDVSSSQLGGVAGIDFPHQHGNGQIAVGGWYGKWLAAVALRHSHQSNLGTAFFAAIFQTFVRSICVKLSILCSKTVYTQYLQC